MDGKHRTLFIVPTIIILTILLLILALILGGAYYILHPQRKQIELTEDDVTIVAPDGVSLVAKRQKASDYSHKWAILIHGYRADNSMMNVYAEDYMSMGYNILQPDNRAHGKSQGAFIGMGYLDKYDVLEWVKYILSSDSNAEIVLHGVSMGGATALMLSGVEDVPENVKAIVSDSAYKSADSYIKWKLKYNMNLPSFPIFPAVDLGAKLLAGYYLSDASALEAVKLSNIPTLFIHGEDDKSVSVSDAYELYENAACKKELYIVPDCGHGEAVSVDRQAYFEKVFEFLDI